MRRGAMGAAAAAVVVLMAVSSDAFLLPGGKGLGAAAQVGGTGLWVDRWCGSGTWEDLGVGALAESGLGSFGSIY